MKYDKMTKNYEHVMKKKTIMERNIKENYGKTKHLGMSSFVSIKEHNNVN